MKYFLLYWRHGRLSLVAGKDFGQAMAAAGYGQGATRAVDFYNEGTDIKYKRPEGSKEWVKQDTSTKYIVSVTRTFDVEIVGGGVKAKGQDEFGVDFSHVANVLEAEIPLYTKAIESYQGEGTFGYANLGYDENMKPIKNLGLYVMDPVPELAPFLAHVESCRAALGT